MEMQLVPVREVTVRLRSPRTAPRSAEIAEILALASALEILSLVVLVTVRPGLVAALAVVLFWVGDVLLILGWMHSSSASNDPF
jgi:hypothetical protein